MSIAFRTIKKRLLADPKVQAAYDRLAPEFEIAAALGKAGSRADLTRVDTAPDVERSNRALRHRPR